MGGFGESGSAEEVTAIWTRTFEEVARATGLTRFDIGVSAADQSSIYLLHLIRCPQRKLFHITCEFCDWLFRSFW